MSAAERERSAAAAEQAAAGGTALFVRRPVLAMVAALLVILAGLAALVAVEVRELPDVDRPVVSVSVSFAGAAPETIDREVTSVIEGAAARVAGVRSISSNSTFGSGRVTVEFDDSADLDVAATDLRDAVARIRGRLPDGASDPQIVKADADAQPVVRLSLTSPSLPVEELTRLVEDVVADRLASVNGVADVQSYGLRQRMFRIDVDQDALAARGLTVADLRAALQAMSFDAPAGSISSGGQNLAVRASLEISGPEDVEDVKVKDGVRVGDVARVEFAPDSASTTLRSGGMSGVGLGVIRQARSNTLEISAGVKAEAERINAILPDGATLRVTSDDATFVSGAISEAVMTLLASAAIVVLVILVFLRDWRATMIPAVTLPVALIGTVAAIHMAGFSINILTLLAIVLATGMVVDDAIVVLENIVRRRNQGMGPRAAAVIGTREVFFAVIATTATLAAVFVPLSFLPGQAGGLFREFGFTLAFAVILSSAVALTLAPMMASRLLSSAPEAGQGPSSALASTGGALTAGYRRLLRAALGAPVIVLVLAALFAAFAAGAFPNLRSELTPQEDRAVAMMRISAPQGVALDFTQSRLREVEDLLQPFIDSGEVENLFSVSGFGSSTNSAFMVITLAPWDSRDRPQADIVRDMNAAAAAVPGVRAFAMQPNSLGVRGGGSGLQFAVLGHDYDRLGEHASAMVEALENDGRFMQPRLSTEATQPQVTVAVDREAASRLGVSAQALSETVQAMIDGRETGSIFIDGRSYAVRMTSSSNPVRDAAGLENLFLRAGDGRVIPMSSLASIEERAVAPRLSREQQMRSVSVTAGLAPGIAIGDAYRAAEELAREILPEDIRIAPLAEAASIDENARGMALTFGFALVVILLVLAAQFESFTSAVIVMATVPLGLACAVFALLLTGGSLNVYSQIGLVLLVGVMAKNGILVVEFANQLRDRGMEVREAVEEAAAIRLRPVAMTVVSTVLGAVPLIVSSGAGAEARQALGWVIFGGLGMAAAATLVVTPVAYLLLAGFSKPRASESARLLRELDEAAAAAR